MDRVFLDANALFSAAYKPKSALLRFWELPDVELCTSSCAASEARINLTETEQRRRLDELLHSVHVAPEALPNLQLSEATDLPEKDRPIFRAALHAGATHLLTGDLRHFGPLFGRTIRGVKELRPAVYLRARGSISK